MEQVINWLLEDENPEVKYRTLRELVGADEKELGQARKALLASDTFTSIMDRFNLGKKWETYGALSALAEFGLTREDAAIDEYVEKLIEETNFQMMCGEALLLRNLVLLGYGSHPRVEAEIPLVFEKNKPDGGYGCMSKKPKINIEKGCFRQSCTYLLLAAALKQKGITSIQPRGLLDYFLNREVLFSRNFPDTFAVPDLAGTYYPLDPVKTGLQMTMYALSVLGVADDARCGKAWAVLEGKKDEDGRYVLDKSLSKPIYKIGKPGKPDKWVTLYALLAKKYK